MGTNTTANTYDTLESLAGLKATDRVSIACGKCHGTGVYQGYSGFEFYTASVASTTTGCFDCNGHGARSVLVSSRRQTIRKRIAADAAAAAKAAAVDAAIVAFDAEHPGLRAWLRTFEGRTGFLGSLADKGHYLSAKQIEVAERIRTEEAEKAAAPKVELAEGRRTLQGIIRSVKEQDSQWGVTFKMVLDLQDGTRVFGSVPNSLWDTTEEGSLVGKTVQLTATVERSAKDVDFGFYSRPTKASVVA